MHINGNFCFQQSSVIFEDPGALKDAADSRVMPHRPTQNENTVSEIFRIPRIVHTHFFHLGKFYTEKNAGGSEMINYTHKTICLAVMYQWSNTSLRTWVTSPENGIAS